MKHTQEEILNALRVIKETCEEQTDCRKCPFGNASSDCLIVGFSPVNYQLNDGTGTWRALK